MVTETIVFVGAIIAFYWLVVVLVLIGAALGRLVNGPSDGGGLGGRGGFLD